MLTQTPLTAHAVSGGFINHIYSNKQNIVDIFSCIVCVKS